MKITILCSSETHPISPYLMQWIEKNKFQNEIELVHRKVHAKGGDILFLVSCSEIINEQDRSLYSKSLVVHASDLPNGRGWSPHIWQILNGKTTITVTLFEAADKVDSGDIWQKVVCRVPPDAIWHEINDIIFDAEMELLQFAVDSFHRVVPVPQPNDDVILPSYYRKRTPADSELDINKTLAEQFDIIRVSDPGRFPAFFRLHGHTYNLCIWKVTK